MKVCGSPSVYEVRTASPLPARRRSACSSSKPASLISSCARTCWSRRGGGGSATSSREAGQCLRGRLFEHPFAAHHALQWNHDGLVGGRCYGSRWELFVLCRVQQQQGGRSRSEDVSGHASQEQTPASAAPVGREPDLLHVREVRRMGADHHPGGCSLHVLRLHACSLRL